MSKYVCMVLILTGVYEAILLISMYMTKHFATLQGKNPWAESQIKNVTRFF
jgi:hypothetical protein